MNTKTDASPSRSELRFLRELWRRGRLSARELHDATHEKTEWSYSTTRKTLDRMTEKGILRVETVHGLKTFLPAQNKLATMASLIRGFADNVLELDGPLPTSAFAQSRLLDDDEIAELETLLEQDR
ncbi:MAG: BlaI/MecI/CopY family transcriptional regulator [Myxococcota bacterium]